MVGHASARQTPFASVVALRSKLWASFGPVALYSSDVTHTDGGNSPSLEDSGRR